MRNRQLFVLLLHACALFGISSALCNAQSARESGQDQAAINRADQLVRQMTLDEKLQFLVSKYANNADPGGGSGYIQGIPRLGILDLNISDSGTGSGSSKQQSSTFPATIALAASWNRQLSFDYGAQIARELRAQGSGMGLGGGVNLTRDPRGGRGFEYLGEDPELAGELISQR